MLVANDLGDERSLVAVTDNENQAKGDEDSATWMPKARRRAVVHPAAPESHASAKATTWSMSWSA